MKRKSILKSYPKPGKILRFGLLADTKQAYADIKQTLARAKDTARYKKYTDLDMDWLHGEVPARDKAAAKEIRKEIAEITKRTEINERAASIAGLHSIPAGKLTIKLEKFERALVFQVLTMDERFRAREYRPHHLSNNEFRTAGLPAHCTQVFSMSCPDLTVTGRHMNIYLRGEDTTKDLELTVLKCASNEERDERYDRIIKALSQWAENWAGFKSQEAKQVRHAGLGTITFL